MIAKTILKKGKVRELMLSDTNTYYTDTVINKYGIGIRIDKYINRTE